jgi:8-oxo-dGTP pyrophosphatase MutT (NUDIX family)
MNQDKAHYVVVTGIIVKDGKFLIAKRSEKELAFPGRWTVPGGKLEASDYTKMPKSNKTGWYQILEKVLVREIGEEVGLEVKDFDYVTNLTFIRPDNIPVVVLSLMCNWKAGDVELCNDLTEYKWVNAEEAKDYDLIAGIQEELELAEKLLKGEKAELELRKD